MKFTNQELADLKTWALQIYKDRALSPEQAWIEAAIRLFEKKGLVLVNKEELEKLWSQLK